MNQLALITVARAPALAAPAGARLLSRLRILHRADQESEHGRAYARAAVEFFDLSLRRYL